MRFVCLSLCSLSIVWCVWRGLHPDSRADNGDWQEWQEEDWMAKQTLRFRAKIEGKEAGVVAAITPPVDVPKFFGTRARVPVRGTINGFPFRSSLMPCGGRHMMPVNQTLCRGAGVAPGDVV